ncbi:hypothetical protein LROSRS0_1850 [Furfurilactobacillus rossiae]|nr:hypothetical protein LROSRS0_1850 [Furfurilactobacillus rossiae]
MGLIITMFTFIQLGESTSFWTIISAIGAFVTAFVAIAIAIANQRLTLKISRENRAKSSEFRFSESRPFFLIEEVKDLTWITKHHRIIFYNGSKSQIDFDRSFAIRIHNVSEKILMAVKVVIQVGEEKPNVFYTTYIKPTHTNAFLIPKDPIPKDLKITIYFHTEVRERIKLVWKKKNGKWQYDGDQKELEHRLTDTESVKAFKDYDVANFHETKYIS